MSDADAAPASDAAVEAFVDTLDDGDHVERDGLTAHRDDDGHYHVETPTMRRQGLDEDDLRRVARATARYVENWYHWETVTGMDARRAFLRWVEGADDHALRERYDAMRDGGLAQEWGQLHVRVTIEDRERTYDLRHVDDADHEADELEAHHDPLAARDLATYDDKGRYRPLKTAPSLATGWVFPDLDGGDLAETVDFLYPATIANWYRERHGDLDVTHWADTADRQTGIYGVVEELHEDAVDWVAETCCDDSQCLKRREWDYDEDHELDADRGDGPFPCREPCSLVVAAGRRWTKLEEEASRTYEFELTPSEKAQIEEIIDAVADGRIDDIREADVYEGANRYRTRFLRAKRFDEDGNLCGVPTDHEE